MDWYPLLNSIRISLISTGIVFFVGIFLAYYLAKLPRVLKGVFDTILTLPLVLPPTVIGYLILRLLGPKHLIGAWVYDVFGFKMTMNWWSAIFSTLVIIFPLMYRTARAAFESFDKDLAYAGKTLGMSNTRIFWKIMLPCCKQGILAGIVLSFARALGEYGATSMVAGYTPGRTATISTTVYQLWRNNDNVGAMKWVIINIVISAAIMLIINLLEKRDKKPKPAADYS
ncbi:MAG: molybdate ABC transporter permease subunit [Parasporobacterium sp.]|nr:molybdate ABC transporter permease subunit [Parasporobacterium sp.]